MRSLYQRMPAEQVFGYRDAADQVFLDDALQAFGSAATIPGSFRVDYGDGPAEVDAQALTLSPEHSAAVWLDQRRFSVGRVLQVENARSHRFPAASIPSSSGEAFTDKSPSCSDAPAVSLLQISPPTCEGCVAQGFR